MSLLVFLEAIKLAFEIYKELKGKPDLERAIIRSMILSRAQEITQLKQEVQDTGDASKIEDVLSRHSLR